MQLYDHLLQFQLFQGLSRLELLQMAGNTKFGFMKVGAGATIVKEGDVCQQLIFIIKGDLQLTTTSTDHGYSVVEELTAPWLIQPEVLFGTSLRYSCTAKTVTEAHFITLSKDEVIRLLNEFLIIRLNMLNLYASVVQRYQLRQWRRPPQTLRERTVRFLMDHCTYPAGRKEFRILMTRLADELGDSRLDVSRVLNTMRSEGLIELYRGRIVVPSLERMLMG